MGVGIEVRGLNAWYGKNQSLKSIDMTVAAKSRNCGHRTLGMRQKYLRALSQSHARDHS